MILAAVSPVFNRMFYGNFKEGKSDEVNLQEENSSSMKLFIDFIYTGNCILESVDDVLPLMKVVDYYQVNKVPFQLMCGKLILNKLDSLNYLDLLPKFACVMSKESIKRAADRIMCYSNCNFIEEIDNAECLPEEVLLSLLQRNDIRNTEIEIFDFLVKWHDYQTKELNKTIKLVHQLFLCIRYALINPQFLLTNVANCVHVSKQVLMEALDCLYNKPLDDHHECKCGECKEQSTNNTINRPRLFSGIKWTARYSTTISFIENTCHVRRTVSKLDSHNVQAVYSESLQNGLYSFSISDGDQVSLSANDSISQLYNFPVNGYKVVAIVYENNIFVKTIKDNEVNTSYSTTASPPFHFSVLINSTSVRFQIIPDV